MLSRSIFIQIFFSSHIFWIHSHMFFFYIQTPIPFSILETRQSALQLKAVTCWQKLSTTRSGFQFNQHFAALKVWINYFLLKWRVKASQRLISVNNISEGGGRAVCQGWSWHLSLSRKSFHSWGDGCVFGVSEPVFGTFFPPMILWTNM